MPYCATIVLGVQLGLYHFSSGVGIYVFVYDVVKVMYSKCGCDAILGDLEIIVVRLFGKA